MTPTGPDAPVTVEETEPDAGNIVVQKETDPDGDTQEFHLRPELGRGLPAHRRPAEQLGRAGRWHLLRLGDGADRLDLTSATCSDGSPISAIALGAGETVTCTFLNTQQQGNIVIQKATDPECASTVFDFTASYDSDGFQLAGCQQNDSGPLDAGTYSVSEAAEPGWELTGTSVTTAVRLMRSISTPARLSRAPSRTSSCRAASSSEGDGPGRRSRRTSSSSGPTYSEPFSLSDGESNNPEPSRRAPTPISEIGA